MYSLKEEERSELESTQHAEEVNTLTPEEEEEEEAHPSPAYHEHAEEDVWYEQQDPASGGVYFYNSVTGESTWEAPEWVVEYDEYSGIRYARELQRHAIMTCVASNVRMH